MDYTRRRFIAASGALALAACGGGGGGEQHFAGGPVPVRRSDLLYGYYGDDAQQADEVAEHTNLYLSSPWEDIGGAIANIGRARSAGLTQLVVMVNADVGEPFANAAVARGWLGSLRGARCLDGMTVRALYWRDEPNIADPDNGLGARDDAYCRETNRLMRAMLAADFPELGHVGLWTIMADKPDLPALDDWDAVGGDDYPRGCSVLGPSRLIERIRAGKRGDAGTILVPSPVAENPVTDPACFEDFANRTPDVVAVVPFIWRDRWDRKNPSRPGIRSSTARAAYTALGKRLTGKP